MYNNKKYILTHILYWRWKLAIDILKLKIPSTLNIDLILWHTQLIVYTGKFQIMGYFFQFSS